MACNSNRAEIQPACLRPEYAALQKIKPAYCTPKLSQENLPVQGPLLSPRLLPTVQQSAALLRNITVRRCPLFTSLTPQRVGLNLVKKLLPSNCVLDRRHHGKTYTTAWTFNTMGHSGQHKNLMSKNW